MEERGKKGMDGNKCLGGRNDAGGKASFLNAGSMSCLWIACSQHSTACDKHAIIICSVELSSCPGSLSSSWSLGLVIDGNETDIEKRTQGHKAIN